MNKVGRNYLFLFIYDRIDSAQFSSIMWRATNPPLDLTRQIYASKKTAHMKVYIIYTCE